EVDDPAELETAFLDETQFRADARARLSGEARELRGLAGDEEDGIAFLEAELRADRFGALRADVLRDRPCAFQRPAFVAEEDVAQARLPLALRPGIHAVAEGAVAAAWRRDRPDLDLRVLLDHA